MDALGRTNSFTYDARGYLVKSTNPDGSWTGSGYDNYGNRIKQTNELGKVWTWNYNELSQMTNSVDPLGRTTTYEYGMGQGGCCGGGGGGLSSVPTQIITPSGRTNVFQYDAGGRKSAEILASGTAEAATNRLPNFDTHVLFIEIPQGSVTVASAIRRLLFSSRCHSGVGSTPGTMSSHGRQIAISQAPSPNRSRPDNMTRWRPGTTPRRSFSKR